MIRRDEAAVYLTELAVTAAYAAILERQKRTYEPDWTWVTVMLGVIISATPAMHLARTDTQTHWPDYERRAIAGFCTSGLIIIGWQLWQTAWRWGREHGYDLAQSLTPGGFDHADTTPPLEPQA